MNQKNLEDIPDNLEQEILENEDNLSSYEVKPFDLLITKEDRSVGTLVKWIINGKIVIPDFQRGLVWPKEKKERFIDSIYIGIPIPSFIFYEGININPTNNTKESIVEIIDGLQRLITLTQFIKPEYLLDGDEQSRERILYKGKSFDENSKEFKENFKDTSMNVTFFRWRSEPNASEQQKAKYEVFRRINTGSESLSSQEVRNAVFMSEQLKKIIAFTKEEIFLSFIKNDKKYIYNEKRNRKFQDEFLIRLLAYNILYKNSDSLAFKDEKKIIFLNNFMEEIIKEKINIDELLIEAKKVLLRLNLLNGNNKLFYSLKRNGGYREPSSSISEIFAEALFIYIANSENNPTLEKIQELKQKIYKENAIDKNIYKCFFQSTVSAKNVTERVRILSNFFDK